MNLPWPFGRSSTTSLPAAAPTRCRPPLYAVTLSRLPRVSSASWAFARWTLAAFSRPSSASFWLRSRNQAALAVERAGLAEQAHKADLLQATEKLQTALLNSISHDLRTPLVAITGALSALDEDKGALDELARRALIENARAEADRLNRLVGNLLHMTRIEAGALKLSTQPCDVDDVIHSSLEAVENRLNGPRIQVRIEPGLPLVHLDFVLIVQVLVNLLDNAIKYSPPDQSIEIKAARDAEHLLITVEDRGPGIPLEDQERVFDKFYRVQHPGSITGTGLGLSICRGIVEAHGGRIHAESGPGGGARIVLALPIRTSVLELSA